MDKNNRIEHNRAKISDEKHLTTTSLEIFSKYSDCLYIGKNDDFIKEKMDKADIVQIEWWNHPLIYNFLTSFTFPPSRMILCSHVNGLSRPNIVTKNVVEFSDIFLVFSGSLCGFMLQICLKTDIRW